MILQQKQHLEECIQAFDEDVTMSVTKPYQRYLFDIYDMDKLNKEKCEAFHSVVQSYLSLKRDHDLIYRLPSCSHVHEYVFQTYQTGGTK